MKVLGLWALTAIVALAPLARADEAAGPPAAEAASPTATATAPAPSPQPPLLPVIPSFPASVADLAPEATPGGDAADAPTSTAGGPPAGAGPSAPAAPSGTALPAARPPRGAGSRGGRGPQPPSGPEAATLTAEAERAAPLLRAEDADVRERAAATLLRIGALAIPAVDAELGRAEAQAARVRALLAELDPRRGAKKGGPGRKEVEPQGPRERWYEEKFREAARRVDRGDHIGALHMLDAILTLEPECPIRERIVALKVRAKELHIRASVLDARLIPKKVLVGPGEAIELTLEAKNVSGEPLELAPPDEDAGGLFGAIEVETLDVALDGSRARQRTTRRLDRPIAGKLGPGESWRSLVTVEAGRPYQPGTFRRVTVSGSVRSQVLARGDESIDRFLPLFAVDIFVLEPSRHALAADPVGALTDALAARRAAKDAKAARESEERIVFATLLAERSSRARMVALLDAALEREDDPAGPAVMAALGAALDRPPESERAVWRAILRRLGE